ncbi:NlpC/P60 family protein [Nonomuraea sp. NEAU-A123]|uniref:NlpC/P60 family protein n=1 Tax=Nonomuraea sp. NEAU-A123 TaxID=2839649 RepID=UPI0020327A23|nr:NlpC/P60 family protein [Nonomuraea sp. NEAU-A123]
MPGVPYTWGGGGPRGPGYGIGHGKKTKRFDCSGLTGYAWASAGVSIGATTRKQRRPGGRRPVHRGGRPPRPAEQAASHGSGPARAARTGSGRTLSTARPWP